MKNIRILKRIVFDNLIIEAKYNYILLNLYTFRREFLNEKELEELKISFRKYQVGQSMTDVDKLYWKLREKNRY